MINLVIGEGVYLPIFIGWGVGILLLARKMEGIFLKLWVDLIVCCWMLLVVALVSFQKIQPQKPQRYSLCFIFADERWKLIFGECRIYKRICCYMLLMLLMLHPLLGESSFTLLVL